MLVLQIRKGLGQVPYWWQGDPAQRYWVEIRKEPGTGTSLWCPVVDEDGGKDPWYELVASVRAEDIIYHWNAREHRFVGRSIAASDAAEVKGDGIYLVPLRDFTPFETDLSLSVIRVHVDDIYALRDQLLTRYGRPLYLPFQFKENRSNLGFMSNYFAKLPFELVSLIFGSDGLAEGLLQFGDQVQEDRSQEDVPAAQKVSEGGIRGFLQPFQPK